jgi:hypothetical protein
MNRLRCYDSSSSKKREEKKIPSKFVASMHASWFHIRACHGSSTCKIMNWQATSHGAKSEEFKTRLYRSTYKWSEIKWSEIKWQRRKQTMQIFKLEYMMIRITKTMEFQTKYKIITSPWSAHITSCQDAWSNCHLLLIENFPNNLIYEEIHRSIKIYVLKVQVVETTSYKICRERLHKNTRSGPTLPRTPRKTGVSCLGLPFFTQR